jgi:mannose-6-phosphate isomerase-like protein (cupin superfamily)
MRREVIPPGRSTVLRINNAQELRISIAEHYFENIFIINDSAFITENISNPDLSFKLNSHYMIINNGTDDIEVNYNQNISDHEIVYDPYKFENSKKENLKADYFKVRYEIPNDHVNTLPKWYSFKFSYPKFNLIFVKPEFGLSIQIHNDRNEFWEILEGDPIIINANKLHYYVEKGRKFSIPIDTYHSIINPNKENDKYIVLRETWNGKFNEKDIKRIFNPNEYFD